MSYYRVKNMEGDCNNGKVVSGLDSIGFDHPFLERIPDVEGELAMAARLEMTIEEYRKGKS